VIGIESHLHTADHPAWQEDPDYNPDVTPHLTAAYTAIQRVPDRIASFREAGYHVIPMRNVPMCRQQRMNVCYLLAVVHAADNEYAQALPWLDQAVALAHALDDQSAEADLLYLRGSVTQRMNRFGHALDNYRAALDLRRTLRQERLLVDREQELLLMVKAAANALTQGDYALTRNLLFAARRAARQVSDVPRAFVLGHDWTWAGYLEARGHPERALQPALRAAATASQDGGEPYYTVRLHSFAARLATDLAVTHEDGSIGRITQMNMASYCLRTARQALEPTDRTGKGVIEMRQARLDALRHQPSRALQRIAGAEEVARAFGDDLLLVQALTVHGQILAEQRETWTTALCLYREAQAIATERGMPYTGLPAWRAMRQLEELLPEIAARRGTLKSVCIG
jgi:tetratricopeptide (TPR) repeat protein